MTEYVPGDTTDAQQELLVQLRDLVPSAFLDGELDREALLDALDLTDSQSAPAFTFSWPSIGLARKEARAATTATLVPDEAASVAWADARDVLVEGDNLQVLKLLKNGYTGKVKLIYIDPPYNTGESFTYNDDFAVPESEYLRATGQFDEQGNAMTSRLETAGRKHDPWLTMMFSRLTVARRLLRQDGVFLASIDNNEIHHLRLLLDAVFGPENFIDMMTWQGGRKGDAKLTAGGQDYVLVYARDKAHLKALDIRWRERKSGLEGVYVKSQELLDSHESDHATAARELRAWFRELPDGNPSKQHSHFNQIDAGGVWTSGDASSPNYRANLVYEFEGYPAPANGWRYEPEVMARLSAEAKVLYPGSDEGRLRLKRYLKDQEDWAPGSTFARERGAAQTSLDNLLGETLFDAPKNTDVLARLFHSMTQQGDLILDFFAGSGSTGQAVWEQNPKDGKTRQWVLVQRPETPDTSTESGRNAVAAGYDTIFEVTAERLRRAAVESPDRDGNTPGFRVFRARETNLIVEPPIIATAELTGQTLLSTVIDRATQAPVVEGADVLAIAWEVALKATDTRLDARVVVSDVDAVSVVEFIQSDALEGASRLFVSLSEFTLATADAIGLTDDDTLILRSDKVSDDVTLTLAPRLQSKLILLERVPREVSL